MKRINENIAYSRSILNKQGITRESPEYQDYQKIREICGNNNGYVGILTKIRFVDGIEDMDEIESVFNVLKNSKIDINKLNRMSYEQILDIFYDQFSETGDNTDLELIYKDNQYSYYRVYTYKGILKIGSPSWCLKTKKHWDNYNSKYPQQWVVIDNRYAKNIITPENNYLSKYESSKGWIRYGISMNDDSYVAFSDNNKSLTHHPQSWTFYGVFLTIINLRNGVMKSYYNSFPGCEKVPNTKTWSKVLDKKRVSKALKIPEDTLDKDDEVYLICSKTYSNIVGLIRFNSTIPGAFYPAKGRELQFVNLTGKVSKKLMEDYAQKSNDTVYFGIKLEKGFMSDDEIKNHEQYIGKVGKWLIFNRNSNFYQVVNTEQKDYQIPTFSMDDNCFEMNDPMFFYVNKEDFDVFNTLPEDYNNYALEVIDFLKDYQKPPQQEPTPPPAAPQQPPQEEPEEEEKKVRGFWDFFRRR